MPTLARGLPTVSVAEAATSRLRESLFAGEYEAGQEIKDTQIATEYGIARPTARIAVQELINEGVLVRPAGSSARVRSFDPPGVRDLYRVRELIELDAIREIARQDLPLNRIKEALDVFANTRLQDGEQSWTHYAAADVAFHSAVVATSSSPRLQSYFTGISSEIRLLIALLRADYTDGAALYAEHEELFTLLNSRASIDAIERAWREHFESAALSLERRLA